MSISNYLDSIKRRPAVVRAGTRILLGEFTGRMAGDKAVFATPIGDIALDENDLEISFLDVPDDLAAWAEDLN